MSENERNELREYRRALVHQTSNLMAMRFAIRHNMPDAYRRASAALRRSYAALRV